MSELVVCTTCRRHVREGEARCPFCRTARAPAVAPIVAAALAAGATFLAACDAPSTTNATKDPSSANKPPSSATTSAGPADTTTSSTTVPDRPAVKYGMPPSMTTPTPGATESPSGVASALTTTPPTPPTTTPPATPPTDRPAMKYGLAPRPIAPPDRPAAKYGMPPTGNP